MQSRFFHAGVDDSLDGANAVKRRNRWPAFEGHASFQKLFSAGASELIGALPKVLEAMVRSIPSRGSRLLARRTRGPQVPGIVDEVVQRCRDLLTRYRCKPPRAATSASPRPSAPA